MALLRTIDATTEPVTTAEAKTHLRVTSATDDVYIATLVKACRQKAESELQRSLITQTWEKTLDEFPDAITLDTVQIVAEASFLELGAIGGYGHHPRRRLDHPQARRPRQGND